MKLKMILFVGISQSCAFNVKVPRFDTQQTKLEKQLLGEYQDIDEDILLKSNLRSNQKQKSSQIMTEDYAKQLQLFNKDDLEELKQKKLIGEDYTGYVKAVPNNLLASELSDFEIRLRQIVLEEENSARQTIFQSIKNKESNLSLDHIGKTYAQLKFKETEPGQYLYTEAKQWVLKSSEK